MYILTKNACVGRVLCIYMYERILCPGGLHGCVRMDPNKCPRGLVKWTEVFLSIKVDST